MTQFPSEVQPPQPGVQLASYWEIPDKVSSQ